jgi:hypothetical protein
MSRSTIFIILGLVVLITPFSGVYHSWSALIEALCGIAFVGYGVSMRAALARKSREAAPAMPAEVAPAPTDESPHLSPIS